MRNNFKGEIGRTSSPLMQTLIHNVSGWLIAAVGPLALLVRSNVKTLKLYSRCFGWNDSLPGIENASRTPLLSIQPSGNYGNSFSINHRVQYSNYTALEDYEACIPKEEQGCFQVSIYMLSVSSYEISFDSVVIPTGDQVFYDSYLFDLNETQVHQVQFPVTSTEIGNNCYPVCEEDENLFDHYQFNGYWGTINTHEPFRIDEVDSDSNALNCNRNFCRITGLSSDQDDFYRLGLYRHRACLPASTCYSFLVGRQYYFDPFSYAVHYNEDLVIERDNILRISQAYLGDDCKPKCNEEDESTVDFSGLFWTMDCTTYAPPTFTWNISDPSSKELLTGGAISACGTDGTRQRLFREVVCVPRGGTCTTLNLSIDNNIPFDTTLNYAITMDDTTYRNAQLGGNYFGPIFNKTLLGNCTQSNCMPEEDLIEISLRTPMEFTQNGINQTAIPSASSFSFTPGTIDWQVDYADGRYSEYPEQSSGYFVYSAYELDTKFRALMCIPSGDCIYDASFSADAPVVDYSVKQNGVHINTETRNQFEGSTWVDPYFLLVASLGDRCNTSSLSGGAIAGIVIASIVVFVAVIGGVYLLHKKNQQQQ